MRKHFAAIAVVAALGVTGGTALGLANTEHNTSTSVGAAPTSTVPGKGRSQGHRWGHRSDGGRLSKVLDDLVAKGTITRAQADAIIRAMKADSVDKPKRGVGHGRGFLRSFADIEAKIAKTLGISTDELRSQLRQGRSIAAIAKAHGVSSAKIVSVISSAINAQIDKAVADGHLTKAQATKIEADTKEFVTRWVSGEGRGFGFGFPGRGGPPRFGGPGNGDFGRGPDSSAPPTTNAARPGTTPAPPSTSPQRTTPPPAPPAPTTTEQAPPTTI